MKDTEAVALYWQAMSATPGEPDEFGADMWTEVLRDLDYRDTRAALIALLARQTFIAPADLVREVRRIRARRLEQVNPEDLIPPAGLSVLEDVEWRRNAIKAIANGAPVPTNTRGELKPRDLRQLGTVADRTNLD